MKYEITYAREGDCYPLTAIPGLMLDHAFWQAHQKDWKMRDTAWHLAVQEVRRCRGLRLDWYKPLVLECPDDYNPASYAFNGDLPSKNLELALLGRLGDWKLLLLEFYSGEVWAHFYNPVRLEWQTGVLLQKSDDAYMSLAPDLMYVHLPNEEWANVTYTKNRNGDWMAHISEFVAEARKPYRVTTVEDVVSSDGPVVETREHFYGEEIIERLKNVFVEK